MRRSAKWSVGRKESFRDGDDCMGSKTHVIHGSDRRRSETAAAFVGSDVVTIESIATLLVSLAKPLPMWCNFETSAHNCRANCRDPGRRDGWRISPLQPDRELDGRDPVASVCRQARD